MSSKALKSAQQAVHRGDAALRRVGQRKAVMRRYTRTQQLMEIGELAHESGLLDLVGYDHATFFGAMLELTAQARSGYAHIILPAWQQRGLHGLSQLVAPDRAAVSTDEKSANEARPPHTSGTHD